KWLVFSSKANSAYTQLFLAHIDSAGHSSPPVLLEHFVTPGRAANIPEFVPAGPDAITLITERFVDDVSYIRAGNSYKDANDWEDALRYYRKALKVNPNNIDALIFMTDLLRRTGRLEEAATLYLEVIRLQPDDARSYNNLGYLFLLQHKLKDAERYFSEALRLK